MRCCCITLFVPPILLVGCASNNEMKRPFMFKEAKLPVGYPPPGPVGEVIVKEYPAYRMPSAPLSVGCMWDDEARVAVCGDWCQSARIEGAFLSGLAAAERLIGRDVSRKRLRSHER